MNMIPLYIGIGVGVTAALAYGLYKYITRERKDEDPTVDPEESEFQLIETINYETLLIWLKKQYKEGVAQSGDSFVIIQDMSAEAIFKEAFQKEASLLKTYSCIAIAIVHNDDVKKAKFYLYKEIAPSLSEMLPDDKNTTYVQNLV